MVDYSKWDALDVSEDEDDRDKAYAARLSAERTIGTMPRDERAAAEALGEASPALKRVVVDIRTKNPGLPSPLGPKGWLAFGRWLDGPKGSLEFRNSDTRNLDDLVVRLAGFTNEVEEPPGMLKLCKGNHEWRGAEAVAFLALVQQGTEEKRKQVDTALEWAASFNPEV
eukprot:CAMPEP_0119275160 /NCGR_PEP_ID=MMETSP1329-20130426/13333_1 /TAXON_ID=114041 /ORGANISM="Genus nov. species nov., Strain RCC1024" /LENGTH=168 /DNA_ID=CAMNT_0007275523 /DNA_START=167 /DNA_END=670 /DNA_ORIENTATION=+